MLRSEGTWSIVFELEIKGTNSINEDIGRKLSVSIPLTDVCTGKSAEETARVLWGLLTREMVMGYVDLNIEDGDEVFIRNPQLALEGVADSLEREL